MQPQPAVIGDPLQRASEYGRTDIDAELQTPFSTVQLARYTVFDACECNVTQASGHRLLYFSRRPPDVFARAVDRWKPGRFEPLGDLVLLPEGERLITRGGAGAATAICVQLDRDLMRRWMREDRGWSENELAACLNIKSSALRSLMTRLAEETLHPGFAAPAMVEAISIEVAIEIARHCSELGDEPMRGGIQAWRLRVIDERLAESPSAPTVLELAKLCNVSSRQLARTFRTSCGVSIGDYVAQKRVERAKHLLGADKSIKTIAHEMGFSSTSGFCYSFRKATGQTPGAFRAEARKRGRPAKPRPL